MGSTNRVQTVALMGLTCLVASAAYVLSGQPMIAAALLIGLSPVMMSVALTKRK